MSWKPSLPVKISLLALLNVVLLGAVFLGFAASQLRLNLSSFLFAPARDRMVSVSRYLALQLPDLPSQNWTERLNELGKANRVQLYLFDEDGQQLAGNPVRLPEPAQHALRHHPFGRHDTPSGQAERMPFDGLPPLRVAHLASPEQYWVVVPIPLRNRDRSEPVHAAVIWRFDSLWRNPFLFDYRPWVIVIAAIILVSVLCWLPLVRSLTRAISQITRATSQIAEGRFEVSLPAGRGDELGALSRSIQQMSARLSDLIRGQRRFLSDIAHELCSPVARMQAAVAILEQRSADTTREYVGDVAEELDHISGLINELLSFSKAEFAGAPVALTPVEIAPIAHSVAERESGDTNRVEIAINEARCVQARPDLLERALANLVRNALRYAAEGGPITISAEAHGNDVTIAVADHGPGLPETELEHVFKPFYRPELARQRETGGTGLGLAIVRSCVEACGGKVSARNRVPHGLIVEIALKRATPSTRPAEEAAIHLG